MQSDELDSSIFFYDHAFLILKIYNVNGYNNLIGFFPGCGFSPTPLFRCAFLIYPLICHHCVWKFLFSKLKSLPNYEESGGGSLTFTH